MHETRSREELAAALADLQERVDNAQRLANMGDYDWHIASDTNRWSDQLYRIYGHEPQSFNASYERFLELIHPDDRERITGIHQRAYATGEPYEMIERIVRPDGQTRYLSSNGQVLMGPDGTPERMRGTCIDITDRVRAEEEREKAAARLWEVQVRRRQALELNDNVVQGLTAAVFALTEGDTPLATAYLERTLASARRLMNEWLEPDSGEQVRPGDLMRESPSRIDVPEEQPAGVQPRILVVDDNDDVRRLLRRQLERAGRFDVVGEASDGAEAVEAAGQLQPDVVLLDLSMPVMDGLQALPLIIEKVSDVRVIVLSAFDAASMAATALAAGASRYLEKGLRMDVIDAIDGVLQPA